MKIQLKEIYQIGGFQPPKQFWNIFSQLDFENQFKINSMITQNLFVRYLDQMLKNQGVIYNSLIQKLENISKNIKLEVKKEIESILSKTKISKIVLLQILDNKNAFDLVNNSILQVDQDRFGQPAAVKIDKLTDRAISLPFKKIFRLIMKFQKNLLNIDLKFEFQAMRSPYKTTFEKITKDGEVKWKPYSIEDTEDKQVLQLIYQSNYLIKVKNQLDSIPKIFDKKKVIVNNIFEICLIDFTDKEYKICSSNALDKKKINLKLRHIGTFTPDEKQFLKIVPNFLQGNSSMRYMLSYRQLDSDFNKKITKMNILYENEFNVSSNQTDSTNQGVQMTKILQKDQAVQVVLKQQFDKTESDISTRNSIISIYKSDSTHETSAYGFSNRKGLKHCSSVANRNKFKVSDSKKNFEFVQNANFVYEMKNSTLTFSKQMTGFIFNSKRPGKPNEWPQKTRDDIPLADHHIVSKHQLWKLYNYLIADQITYEDDELIRKWFRIVYPKFDDHKEKEFLKLVLNSHKTNVNKPDNNKIIQVFNSWDIDQLQRRLTWQEFNMIEGPSPDTRTDDPMVDIDLIQTQILTKLDSKQANLIDKLKRLHNCVKNEISTYQHHRMILLTLKHNRDIKVNCRLQWIFDEILKIMKSQKNELPRIIQDTRFWVLDELYERTNVIEIVQFQNLHKNYYDKMKDQKEVLKLPNFKEFKKKQCKVFQKSIEVQTKISYLESKKEKEQEESESDFLN